MKLWDKGYNTDNIVEQFTVGNDRILDQNLAKYDALGNKAHAKMLNSIGLLTDKELEDLLGGLDEIMASIEAGTFVIEEQFEDVHSKIEFELTQKIGDAGKKIHSARSRNDQVLVDLHLYTKDELITIKNLVKNVFDQLLVLAESHKDKLLPGYTHLQVAMPSSFGLWFSAYAESLVDDMYFVNAAFKIADQNPLGSAAGYGSSFPINRSMTTKELGFETMKFNVVAAQMSRGKLEKSVSMALASVAGTLAKFAADVCLYMSQNFTFVSFPKELTTGSSIMPHKQNPDVFELMRAKCNKIQNLPAEISGIVNNLTSGYFRDLQLLKESYMEGIELLKENLTVLNFMLQHIEVKDGIVDDQKYDFLFSVEELNKMVLNGETFREAYQQLGKQILGGDFRPEKTVNHTHEGSIGNLCLPQIQEKFNKAFE